MRRPDHLFRAEAQPFSGRKTRQLIMLLLAFGLTVPLVGCNDNDDPGFTHTVLSTDVPTRETSSETLPPTATTLRPAPTREVPRQATEVTVGRQPTVILPEVGRFRTIGFDVAGFRAGDTLTLEGTALQDGSDWKAQISTYEGDILVDIYLDGEYSVSFQLNDPPVRIEIEIEGDQFFVHAISQYDVNSWGNVSIDPDNLATPHQVTAQQTAGSSHIVLSGISVH